MSDSLPDTAITACPDCGTELNDTDKNTARLWCPRCARYHLPPSGKRDEAGQAAYAEGVAAERARIAHGADPVMLRRAANQLAISDAPLPVTECLFLLADLLDGAS